MADDEMRYGVLDFESDQVEIWYRLDWAVEYHDDRTKEGRTCKIYVMSPVCESALWDWAVEHEQGKQPMVYVSERAARSCVRSGGRLLRRRLGTQDWAQVID